MNWFWDAVLIWVLLGCFRFSKFGLWFPTRDGFAPGYLIIEREMLQNTHSKQDSSEGSEVKNMPAIQEMQEVRVGSLCQEDPLEEGMATHSGILAWRIPMDRGAWWATVHGVAKNQTWLSMHMHTCNKVVKLLYFFLRGIEMEPGSIHLIF